MGDDIRREPKTSKIFILSRAIVTLVFSGIIGGIYIGWMANVNQIQSAAEDYCAVNADFTCCGMLGDSYIYDSLFYFGPWSDKSEAESLFS